MKYLEQVSHVHGPYTYAVNGRKNVNVYTKDGRRRFVSYPKFLVEVVLGRELDPKEETVDHIDGDFHNNNWNNLRVVDQSTHSSEDHVRVRRVKVVCVWCGETAHRRPEYICRSNAQHRAGPFCGRRCTGLYGAFAQNNKLPKPRVQYYQWDSYTGVKPIYYTVTKLGETVADVAKRLHIALPTEDEILAALPRNAPRKLKEARPCAVCGASTKNKKYCSTVCSSKTRRKAKRPSPEKLYHLVWKYPTSYIAKKLGVSDVAVAKWCKQYNVDKPPRGYWTKKRAEDKTVDSGGQIRTGDLRGQNPMLTSS